MFECDVMAWGSVIYKSKLLNSFVEAIINMVCDLKITSRSEKNCKNFMVIRHSVEKLSAKNSVTRP